MNYESKKHFIRESIKSIWKNKKIKRMQFFPLGLVALTFPYIFLVPVFTYDNISDSMASFLLSTIFVFSALSYLVVIQLFYMRARDIFTEIKKDGPLDLTINIATFSPLIVIFFDSEVASSIFVILFLVLSILPSKLIKNNYQEK